MQLAEWPRGERKKRWQNMGNGLITADAGVMTFLDGDRLSSG
jgi:hypothetical protein